MRRLIPTCRLAAEGLSFAPSEMARMVLSIAGLFHYGDAHDREYAWVSAAGWVTKTLPDYLTAVRFYGLAPLPLGPDGWRSDAAGSAMVAKTLAPD